MVFEPFNCVFCNCNTNCNCVFFLVYLFFNPSLAEIINRGYFSAGRRNTTRRYLTISAWKKKERQPKSGVP